MKKTFLILFCFSFLFSKSQNDSTCFLCPAKTLNKSRITVIATTEATLYAASLIGLNSIWYKDYPRTGFHYFNDNDEWEGMDKAGHITTAYCVGRVGIDLLQWSGVKPTKAAVYGGLLGFTYQSTIEILDGFSSGWGFSWGDMAANTLGSAIVIGQELGWKEQRISLKFSYSPTGYPKYRPNLLGKSFAEKMMKDYNGQTYWLSANVYSFLNADSKFPKWLNIALGYGADGMTGGTNNPPYYDHGSEIVFKRYSQCYLSLDIDLTRIKTKSKFLKTVFSTFSFIKIPSPALEFGNKQFSVNPFGF